MKFMCGFIPLNKTEKKCSENISQPFELLSGVEKKLLQNIKREIALSEVGKRIWKTTCSSKLLLCVDSGSFSM